jgi:hypothetical protein
MGSVGDRNSELSGDNVELRDDDDVSIDYWCFFYNYRLLF